jgi:hypothetical protein
MSSISYKFAPLSDAVLLDIAVPRTYKPFHAYCTKRCQIKDWRLNLADIALHFHCSISTVKRALRLFRDLGYAIYDEVKGWRVFPSPQVTVNIVSEPIAGGSLLTPLDTIMEVTFAPHIEKEAFKEKETTPVVVLEEEKLVFPDKLIKEQKKACKAIIKKAPVQLQQAVLFELAYRMTLQTMRSVPAFLNVLVTAANNGTFTHTQAADDTKTVNRSIELANEVLESRRKPANITDAGKQNGMAGIKGLFGGYKNA